MLLTGGAGFIGSHTAVALMERGDDLVLLDNYSNSRRDVVDRLADIAGRVPKALDIDLLNRPALDAVFMREDITAVVHFGGLKAVGESVSHPLEYYENNVLGTLNLLHSMSSHNVKHIVFSSSATVYRSDQASPYREKCALGATNPYGWTKIMIERILHDFAVADSAWSVVILRYFNPAGAHPSGLIGEDPSGVPTNLIPMVARVAAGMSAEVPIFGDDYDTRDGTGVRDYIHVMDLARAHVLALDYMAARDPGVWTFNVGTGRGWSVREVVDAYEAASGQRVNTVVKPRRPGDLAIATADPSLAAAQLGFVAERSLLDMCTDSWRWQQANKRVEEGVALPVWNQLG